MNSQQRRRMRRQQERIHDKQRNSFGSDFPSKADPRPMPMPMVLLLRASRAHFDALCVRRCKPKGRRESHMMYVLDMHKYRVHGGDAPVHPRMGP